MSADVVQETELFSDDSKLVCDLLRKNWSLNPGEFPNFAYTVDQYMVSSRVGVIYIYPVSRSNSISSVNYQTLMRTSVVSIRMSTPFRNTLFLWSNEVYRILMAFRRKGVGDGNLGIYSYLEVLGDRQSTDLSGWYAMTLDVKLISNCVPIKSAGFGDAINKKVYDAQNS